MQDDYRDRLPALQREKEAFAIKALNLKRRHGLSNENIGKRINCSAEYVGVLLKLARGLAECHKQNPEVLKRQWWRDELNATSKRDT